MKIVISNIEQFRNFFDVIYDDSAEEVELKFYMDKMTCAILNRGKTKFFYVEYESKFFDSYMVDEVSSISVYIEDLYKLMKLANKTDIMTIEFESDVMKAELESNGNKRFFEFTYPYYFADSPKFPSVDLAVHMDVDTKDLSQSVKDIKMVGTEVFQFVISENSLTFMSDNSADTNSFNDTKYAQVINTEVDIDGVMAVRFTLKHIAQMLKFDKISKIVHLALDERALIYSFEDEIMGVAVKGMIAPRMVTEE